MDAGSRPRRSPPSDRFLGLFSSPSLAASSPSAGDELLEGDLLFPAPSSPSDPPPDASKDPVRVPRGHLGLLAALHEGDRGLPGRSGAVSVAASSAVAGTAGTLLRRKATIAAAAAAASSVTPSQSPSSVARAIPAPPRPRDPDLPPAAPFHQSAPVQVPVPPPRRRGRGWGELAGGACDDEDDGELFPGDAAMLPPHEMVARASAGGSYGVPGKPSSMLEGAGRTLKGRDLRRVRDAVLRQTGFLD
ncbi:hypothetical protein QOZ80_2AG0124200 [Eleusine coracana subsp. coracana]|nr:hypothetical protein QOZ80_2AG0124200 [Eleusine coracana subsp. coracana]